MPLITPWRTGHWEEKNKGVPGKGRSRKFIALVNFSWSTFSKTRVRRYGTPYRFSPQFLADFFIDFTWFSWSSKGLELLSEANPGSSVLDKNSFPSFDLLQAPRSTLLGPFPLALVLTFSPSSWSEWDKCLGSARRSYDWI